jgi:Ca2+-binding RTX toxin-like protein
LTSSYNSETGFYEESIEVLLANEEGEFETGETIELDDSFDYIDEFSLVDLNGDGDLDILVKDNYVYDQTLGRSIRQASIILGEGNGEFETPSPTIEVDQNYNSPFTVGDFNGDGNFDLVIYKNSYSSYSVDFKASVLLGTGNGGFTEGGEVEIDNPEEFVSGDFNGDGDLDLLAYTTETDPETFITQYQLQLFFGDGDGNLEAQPDLDIDLENYASEVIAGDFDGDGNVDVALRSYSYYYYYSSSNTTTVLLGEGNGEFSSPITLTPEGYGDIAIADFNGDGNLDYANSGSYSVQTVSVLLNQTGGDIPVTVESEETYTLQPDEDNLILTGNSNSDGIGNELDNEITGNRRRNLLEGLGGNDTLDGGEGRDTLIGGNGDDLLSGGEDRDVFGFASNEAFNEDIGVDTITDFDPDDDSIELSQTTFTAIASEIDDEFSIPSEFAVVEDSTTVETSEALIVYDQSTGELFYNENTIDPGLGLGGLFVTFENTPLLSAENFTIIA